MTPPEKNKRYAFSERVPTCRLQIFVAIFARGAIICPDKNVLRIAAAI